MEFLWCVRGRRPCLKVLLREEEIDEISLEMMKNNRIEGLARMEPEGDGLLYRPEGEPLDRQAAAGGTLPFRRILTDLAGTLEAIEGYMLEHCSLLLDPAHLFADGETGKTEAVCLPVREEEAVSDKERLRRLVEEMTEGEEQETLLAALELAVEGGRLSAAKLAEALSGEEESSGGTEEPGEEAQGFAAPPLPERPFLWSQDPPEQEMPREKKWGSLFRRKRPVRPEDEETVLLRRGEETVLLRQKEPEAVLIRLSTGEVWTVDRAFFRIGKDPKQNDCCVADNPAVSRLHAVIARRGGAFYLTDLGSTNRTRLEGKVLEKDVEMRLGKSVEFTVADEAFRFEEKEKEEWNM